MRISWDGERIVIDMQGDILISPTGGLAADAKTGAIHVMSLPVDLQIVGGVLVETSAANVAEIELKIRSLLKSAPAPAKDRMWS